ncbi:hypothetical protein ACUW9M_000838 [Serratia sp. 121840015-2]
MVIEGFLIWPARVTAHLEIKHYPVFLLSKVLNHNRMLLTINTEPCYVLYYVFFDIYLDILRSWSKINLSEKIIGTVSRMAMMHYKYILR